MTFIHLISGGAAQALVTRRQAAFEAQHGCSVSATFGVVGIMKDRLLDGAPEFDSSRQISHWVPN
jgi:molybdate transport system substrate-binding protein